MEGNGRDCLKLNIISAVVTLLFPDNIFYWKAPQKDTSPEDTVFKNWSKLLGPVKKNLAENNEWPAIPRTYMREPSRPDTFGLLTVSG